MRASPNSIVIAAAAAARKSRTYAVREVCVPLYMPAPDHRGLPSADLVELDAEDQVVDASGITIGGDEDDDFY